MSEKESYFFKDEFISYMSMKSNVLLIDGMSYIMMRNMLKARAVNGNLLTYCMCHWKSNYFSQVEVKSGTIISHI